VQRVVVLGRGGAGKSTFAAQFGRATSLPVIELDRSFWPPDLTPMRREQWAVAQRELVVSPSCSVVPALPECLSGRGYLHYQTTFAVPDGDEVVMLIKRLRIVVYRINDDKSSSADLRCGDGLAECIQQELLAVPLAM
jgi:hypothetical protein